MRKTKKILEETEEIYEVICNMCGQSIEKDPFGKFCDYLQVDKEWGYLSNIDGQKHSFDLCNKCYLSIVSNFKLNIINEN